MVRRSSPSDGGVDPQHLAALDLLATLVAVVDDGGHIRYANHALEDAVGLSRRTLAGVPLSEWLTQPELLQNALQGARGNEYAVIRYDTHLKRLLREPLPVHLV
ncbi:PAS domain-containing protein, partial [Cutibacterium acnes]